MPYKDPEAKEKWEQEHRSQRLTRRRELRQMEAAWKEAHPEVQDSGAGFFFSLWPLELPSPLTIPNSQWGPAD
jgi:hypothetical protein